MKNVFCGFGACNQRMESDSSFFVLEPIYYQREMESKRTSTLYDAMLWPHLSFYGMVSESFLFGAYIFQVSRLLLLGSG